jgi:hypothetical protein
MDRLTKSAILPNKVRARETYYSKFGFKPKKTKNDMIENDKKTDYKRFKDNKELFKTNRMLSRQDIKDVIKNSHIDDDEMLFYNEFIKPYLKKNEIIDTSIFMKNLVFKEQTEKMKIDNKKRKIICNFINKIYKKLYMKIGYTEYDNNKWTLNL